MQQPANDFFTSTPKTQLEETKYSTKKSETLGRNLLHNWLDEEALFALTHILNCRFGLYNINENSKYDDGNSFTQLITIEKESCLKAIPALLTRSTSYSRTHYERLLVQAKAPLTSPQKTRVSPLGKSPSMLSSEIPSSDPASQVQQPPAAKLNPQKFPRPKS